jgi:hypothetical protein
MKGDTQCCTFKSHQLLLILFDCQEATQVIPNCKRMHTPDNDTMVSSSKKASVLQYKIDNNTANVMSATNSGISHDGKNTMAEHNIDPDYFENNDNDDVLDNATNDAKTAHIISTHPFFSHLIKNRQLHF